MTQEQFEALKPYEDVLIKAHDYRQLMPVTSTDVLKIATVFEQLGYTLDSRNCGHCILAMCANLGKLYMEHKESLSKVTVVEEQPKPKQPKKPVQIKTSKPKTSKKDNAKK